VSESPVTPNEPRAARRTVSHRPTLRDVATLAGVSMKTASRVINGETRVNATLALNVRRAAEVLDYRPNLTARNLRRSGGFTHTLGVVLFDVSNAFSSSLQRAIEDVASERHIVVISSSVDEDPQRERENALALVARQVDGLVVVPAGDDQSYLAREQQLGLKVVFVDRVPQLLRADAVVGDNRAGAYRAVTHLVSHGHTRIAFLGDRDYIGTLMERRQGYFEALRDAGLEADPSLVITNLHAADAIDHAVTTLMAGDAPTALFTAQNFITIESIRALKRLELDDCVALVGFDDFDTADLLRPAISVVSQSPKVMGSLAAQLLLQRIDGDTSPFETHVIPVNFIERGSGELEPRPDLIGARLQRASR
jgi:LacI family transcriptional regulator